jgi:thiol-disulfide isomerase/thioredoxin
MFRSLFSLAILALFAFNFVAPANVSGQDEATSKKAAAELESLQANFQASIKELRAEISKTKDKDKQKELLATNNPVAKFAPQYMELAKKFKGTKASVDATLFVAGQVTGELKVEAVDFLLNNYPDKVKLSKVASSLSGDVPHPKMEGWFNLMIEKSEKDAVKASVLMSYARYVGQLPTFKRTLEISPTVAERLPADQVTYITTPRSDEQKKLLQTRLETLIEKYGDLKFKGRQTYRDAASSELFELTKLQVGMMAPEIEGEDLDEIPFKLSDYRGKVVMLDFWGHWCPPCRAMYTHEQEITRGLADKPFVLLGVNSDGNKNTAVDAVSSEGLGWRHFWNGPKGTRGPISTQWNVEGWPTVYLIDEKGVIRYKEVLGEDIDRGIEKLMAEMGHDINLGGAE